MSDLDTALRRQLNQTLTHTPWKTIGGRGIVAARRHGNVFLPTYRAGSKRLPLQSRYGASL